MRSCLHLAWYFVDIILPCDSNISNPSNPFPWVRHVSNFFSQVVKIFSHLAKNFNHKSKEILMQKRILMVPIFHKHQPA